MSVDTQLFDAMMERDTEDFMIVVEQRLSRLHHIIATPEMADCYRALLLETFKSGYLAAANTLLSLAMEKKA